MSENYQSNSTLRNGDTLSFTSTFTDGGHEMSNVKITRAQSDDQSQTTDAGKLNGVPQRRACGGYYAQYEVDEILELEAEWIIEYVKYATRHKERQDGKL